MACRVARILWTPRQAGVRPQPSQEDSHVNKSILLAAAAIAAASAGAAGAMTPNEFEVAKIAAENVARTQAIYGACQADNAGKLRQAYLSFGERCGSTPKELQELGSFYDARLKDFQEMISKREKKCSYSPSEARERADTLINQLGGVPCKSQTAQ